MKRSDRDFLIKLARTVIKDKLEWPNHVSDLKGWRNEAALLYNISAVPYCYLIDGDGIVVAVNPRGERLENELRKFKKKWSPSIFEKNRSDSDK